jgi:dihydropteroate synthase
VERCLAPWAHRGGGTSLERPVILGILNVTPDSFSDGGRYSTVKTAVERAAEMMDEGADLIDVGGESTRPDAEPVPWAEEWERVGPVIERLAQRSIPVSVDTTKLNVARRALDVGAVAVNDVSGLRFEPEIADLVAEMGAGLVIMHMRGDPRTMQDDVAYGDLVGEVRDFLAGQIEKALRRGCRRDQLVIDPGLGFGKSAEGNLELIARLGTFTELGQPVLVGPSRKSFIGKALDLPMEQRLEGTLAACLTALERGARLFRVHDVGPARRALDMADAIRNAARRSVAPDF